MNREVSTESHKLIFAPAASVVDSSFFVELSNLKLNVQKLDTSYQNILGYYNFSALGSEQSPSLILTDNSFVETENKEEFTQRLPSNSYFLSPGKLLNVNSIEEFKRVNKKDFLIDSAMDILQRIRDKSFLHDPALLSSFRILSYADLKKYKFYYWCAFPQLQSQWEQCETKDSVDYKLQPNEVFDSQFYLINDEGLKKPLSTLFNNSTDSLLKVLFIDTCSSTHTTSYILRNFLTALANHNFTLVEVQVLKVNHFNKNFTTLFLNQDLNDNKHNNIDGVPPVIGWERTSHGKLGPKIADLGALINPEKLAEQAVDLNLKLMKWRLVPDLDLDVIKNTKVLILGAGTLGSYVSRCLLAWGTRHVTFVDSGKVSFSNPVRQPLYNYDDCLSGGKPKAATAAENLRRIFPGVNAKGFQIDIPMVGHPIKDEKKEYEDFKKLAQLVDANDAIFLCLDSREARWLPTLLGNVKHKIVINSALGFESYLVMRHGCIDPANNLENQIEGRLGCYFCSDIVAPKDSLTDRSLDQMCTVTRPGLALLASSLATELFVSILQSPMKQYTNHIAHDKTNILGCLPHQLRGYLHNFETLKLSSKNFRCCTACSVPVIREFREHGWHFVKTALNDSTYLEDVTGLREFHKNAESAAVLLDEFDELACEDQGIE
ncbi:E1-like protein-activating enzyme Gsa7p/Apg7p [Pichia kudriavzevii]|uniref:Ubiquitin-like modifier-activating enzyme ATG7 n=1 Tax=Pichia kudriavzevii TaxID=4909 RepID=A0A1Z8JRE1_PICKU|nr:E1-like protein-activating enzyme Gsa7p/Apg7p [Pichia kudriavzevii]